MGWYVATEDGKQISPIYLDMSFKQAKEWLGNHLYQENKKTGDLIRKKKSKN